MASIKNLTPHPIHLVDENNNIIRTFAPDGLVRLKATTVDAGQIDGCKVTTTQFGEPEGLPEEKEEIFFLVSQLVKSALPSRKDLLVPAEVVRDEKGNIIGCRSFGL